MRLHYFEIWDKFISERNRTLSTAKYKNNEQKFILVLFARINALSEEILFLVKNARFTSSQILMRSALETYIDLKCLFDDEEFIDVLMQAERKSEISYLKNFDISNKYYGTQSKDDIDNKIRELEKLNDKSKNLNIYQKFEKAKELPVYRTVYNSLCRFSHGNVTALASKNFEDELIKLNSSITDTELSYVLSSSINLAILSSIIVLTKLDYEDKQVKVFRDFLNENNEIAQKFV